MPVNSFDHYPMTWRPVLDRQGGSLYLELAEKLEADIRQDRLLPGTRLPPQRELADFLDVNVSTVKKALKRCELRGLLSSVHGSGTFVSYDALSSARLLPESSPCTLVELGTTVPEASANQLLTALLRKMLAQPDADRWFSYSRPEETAWQKDAAVRFFHRCGLETDPSHVLFAVGGQNALNGALAVFRPGDRIGVDPHVFSGIKTAAAARGLKLIPVPQKNGCMDPDALRAFAGRESLRGIYLISTQQNPTTRTIPTETRQRLAQAAGEQDLLIVEDGTYCLMHSAVPAVSAFAPERSIFLSSLSKAVAPGLRIGYLSVPDALRPAVSAQLYNLNVAVPPLMAELSARVIVSGLLDEILTRHREVTLRRSQIVREVLGSRRLEGEDTCIFRWLHLPEGLRGAEMERAALKRGVRIYGAERFAVGSTVPDTAVRLSICGPESEEELRRGLMILEELLQNPSEM